MRRIPLAPMLRLRLATAPSPKEPTMNSQRKGHRPAAAVAWLTALLILFSGCAGRAAEVPNEPARALQDVGGTPLARLVEASTPPAQRHLSGVHLLADGADAWDTRLMLVRRASKSLDLQYYLIADDSAGRQWLQALHDAAERGVRVRLLVDDLHAGALLQALAALDAHRQIEVRLFNPLPVRSGSVVQRVLLSMHEFGRINRRMHNKLFIADNLLAITGGRNIGDEYFMRGHSANFIDLDVLASGPVVQELSASFDAFWNDPVAYPVRSLEPSPGAAAIAALLSPRTLRPGPAGVEPGSVAEQIEDGRLALHFAQVQLFADAPTKVSDLDREDGPGQAMQRALGLMTKATSEVMIASPYFVPGAKGLALIQQARDRDVRVAVVTNSHGATDEPLAYWAYMRYRLDLLRMGVDLAELSPHAPIGPPGERRSSLARLHAKFSVVDRRQLLVGSMNMDLRSSRINTELALAIDSAEVAHEAAEMLERSWMPLRYRLRLARAGQRIEWLAMREQREVVHVTEPDFDWMARLRLGLMSAFVREELL
jgi:putative cardiolipin synthase